MTTTKATKDMTREEKIEALRASLMEWATKPQTIGFSNKTPKGGWTDADKVTK